MNFTDPVGVNAYAQLCEAIGALGTGVRPPIPAG